MAQVPHHDDENALGKFEESHRPQDTALPELWIRLDSRRLHARGE
jgi:hypothetical protein